MMHEVLTAAQQISGGTLFARIHLGHRMHTAAEHGGDLLRVDLVVLRFPAVNSFHVQHVSEDEIDVVIGAKVSDPIPSEHALDPDDDIDAERLERPVKMLSVGWHVPVKPSFSV